MSRTVRENGVTRIVVAFLQAYIFAILAAVYINNSTVGHGDEH